MGDWLAAFGKPSTNGIWLIWGLEKNGKTSLALKLAEYLSGFGKTLYVSAEEGTDLEFAESIKRMNLSTSNRNLHFLEYISIVELTKKLYSKKSADIIFLDNMTIYSDELTGSKLKEMLRKFPKKLFVLLSHEERNLPFPAVSRMASKLAKRIVHVKGLACEVYGRGNAGGTLMIDENRAMIYHGIDITN